MKSKTMKKQKERLRRQFFYGLIDLCFGSLPKTQKAMFLKADVIYRKNALKFDIKLVFHHIRTCSFWGNSLSVIRNCQVMSADSDINLFKMFLFIHSCPLNNQGNEFNQFQN